MSVAEDYRKNRKFRFINAGIVAALAALPITMWIAQPFVKTNEELRTQFGDEALKSQVQAQMQNQIYKKMDIDFDKELPTGKQEFAPTITIDFDSVSNSIEKKYDQNDEMTAGRNRTYAGLTALYVLAAGAFAASGYNNHRKLKDLEAGSVPKPT